MSPSGTFLRGADLPLSEPWGNIMSANFILFEEMEGWSTYHGQGEFKNVGVVNFLKVFFFPRGRRVLAHSLLFGELHVVERPVRRHFRDVR